MPTTTTQGRLARQVALVTGATSGIGEAIARRFAAEGACVAVVGRNADRGAAVVREIDQAGGTAQFFAADVTSDDAVRLLVQAVLQRFGSLDIVVNNAGLSMPGTVVDTTPAQWEQVFSINVASAYLVSHHAMPHLLNAAADRSSTSRRKPA
jgi:NAD(P)-dependent dehydrogenase (short-subunit alcohol dehydrogenase family)